MCATKLSSRKDAMPFLRNSFTTPVIENILVYDCGQLTTTISVDLPKFGQHLPSDKMYPNLWFDFLPLPLPRNDGQILSGANISESSFGRFPFSLISATINPIIWER